MEAEGYMLPSAELTLGFMTGDLETEGIGDLLIPLWNPGGTGLLFVNPRGAITDHDGEEVNLGVGYRQLLPNQNIIVGANVFYDYRDTGYSNYDQWGVGIEMLSTWIDARANYYDPSDKKMVIGSYTETETSQSTRSSSSWSDPYAEEHVILQDYTVTRTLTTTTDTETYEQYEQALGGYDWEIGVKLPLPIRSETLEARIFGGMYDFDRDYGDDAKGWKARAELRILASLFLDGGVYENKELTGSDWYAGARLSVPLDLTKVSQGRNPFSTMQGRLNGKTRDLQSRLTEMVMRDPQVRLEQSKFLENKALATTESTTSSTTRRDAVTLMSDISFVDQDAGVSGNGTAETPYTAIQTGVDNAFGALNVYVYDAAAAYQENVALRTGINLYGSGSLIEVIDGKTFGSGIAPIVDGMSRGPAITVANSTLVRGFTVQNTDTGGGAILVNLPSLGATDISRVGILGNDSTELTITENTLSGNSVGAMLARQGNFNMAFSGNLVQDNDQTGLEVNATGASGTFNVLVENSLFQNNGGDGANIIGDTYDTSVIQVLNSQFNGNSDGLSIGQFDTDLAIAAVSGSTGSGNLGTGLGITQVNNEDSLANISGSTANNNGADGIWLLQDSDYISLGIIGLPEGLGSSLEALAAGFGLALPPEAAALLSATGPVTANNNGGNGVFSINVADDLSVGLFFDITANGNAGNGLFAQVGDGLGIAASIGGSSQNWSEILQLADNIIGPAFGVNLPLSIPGGGQMQLNNNGGVGMQMITIGDLASITAIAGLEATGNTGPGAWMVNQSDGISLSALARANLSGNAAGGLISQTWGTDASISILADLTASNNGSHGIQAGVQSADGIAALLTLSTDAIRPLGAIIGDLIPGFPPIDIPGSAYGSVVASGNAGVGFLGVVDGYDLAIAALLDTVTSGNMNDGVNLTVNSDDGDAFAAILSSDAIYELLPTALGIPPIPYTPIGAVESTFNGGNGIVVNQTADQDAYLLMLGVEASVNIVATGVNVNQTAGNDAYAILADIEAMLNGTGGIFLNQIAGDDAISAIVMAELFGNNAPGLNLIQTATGGAYTLLGGVNSIGHNAPGIIMNLTGGDDAVAALTAVTNSFNIGSDGMTLNITADDEAALLAGDGALALFESNYSGGLGGFVLGLVGGIIPEGDVTFSDNSGLGLNAQINSDNGDVWVSLDGAEANDNGAQGILLDLTAANGSIYTGILNTEASDNDLAGLRVNLTGTGVEALVGLEDITTQGNGNAGISIVETFNGSVSIVGESLVSTGNTGNGVRVGTDGAGAVVDFGGGALGSLGGSSFYGNGNVDMREAGPGGAIVAQGNWWGIAPPAAGQFAGTVDYSNWLMTPPAP